MKNYKGVFKTKREADRKPWYVVGPSRKLIAVKRAGGWSLDALVGKTSFSIYEHANDPKVGLMAYKRVLDAMQDAEAYIAEAEIMGSDQIHKKVIANAIKSKKRYYSE